MRKKELECRLAAAEREIDLLRAKLCGEEHDYVKVGESVWNAGCSVEVEPVLVCARCGKRKVGRL